MVGMGERYYLHEEDGIVTIMIGEDRLGRALTEKDGHAIVQALNDAGAGAGMRDKLIEGITDLIEQAFEQ